MSPLQTQLMSEMKQLPNRALQETLDFMRFLRLRGSIEPDQTYFWTKKWQAMEKAAERDKKRGRVTGDGSVNGLLKALGR